jgi:predicted nucleic acid-binding protein
LYALIDRTDVWHRAAAAALTDLSATGATLVVIDPIFSEAMTLLKVRLGSSAAISVGEGLRASRIARLIDLNEEDRESAWEVFRRCADKEWSYADCACLAFMQSHDIGDALTVDRHFKQMGVTCWPQMT